MDMEYHMPVEGQPASEFQPPGEEYPTPQEGYGTKAQEITKPETSEENPPRKKGISRMLMSAVLGFSIVSSALALQTVPVEDPEPSVTLPPVSQRLVEVGDWIGEDGTRAHFDPFSGWFIPPEDNFSYFTWDVWGALEPYYDDTDGIVYTYNYEVSDDPHMAYHRNFYIVEHSAENPGEAVTISCNLYGSESSQDFFPADSPTPIPPVSSREELLQLIPNSFWKMSYVGDCTSDWSPESGDMFGGFEVRISTAEFTEQDCTITYVDIYGGSKTFHYHWSVQEESPLPVLILEPLEPITYELPDRTLVSERGMEAAVLNIWGYSPALWLPSYLMYDQSTAHIPMEPYYGPTFDPWEETMAVEGVEDIIPPDPVELLLNYGSWISEDNEISLFFDYEGGWWKRTDGGSTYALMSWWTEDMDVAYTGSGAQIQFIESSPDYFCRSLENRVVSGHISILEYFPEPRIMLKDPFTGEDKIYVPGGDAWASSPSYYVTQDLRMDLPETGWSTASFSTMEEDLASANATNDFFIWISGAEFSGDTCSITFSDNYGGSRSFAFRWEYGSKSAEAWISLYPQEEMRYSITDTATGTMTEYIANASALSGLLSVCDDGLVLYLQNPFFNGTHGATHEVMTRIR